MFGALFEVCIGFSDVQHLARTGRFTNFGKNYIRGGKKTNKIKQTQKNPPQNPATGTTAAGLLSSSLLPSSSDKSKPLRNWRSEWPRNNTFLKTWRSSFRVKTTQSWFELWEELKAARDLQGTVHSSQGTINLMLPIHLCTTSNGKDVLWTAVFEFHPSFPESPQ